MSNSIKEYNWLPEDNLSIDIPKEHLPIRCALSYIIVDESPSKNTFRLAIVHPDTFGSWMFPYGGLRISDSDKIKNSKTLSDLTFALHDLINKSGENLTQAITKELSVYFDNFDFKNLPEPEYITYSLKYSANANVWTAYVFLYHRSNIFRWSNNEIKSFEVDMSQDNLKQLIESRYLNGIKIEGNVIQYLYYLKNKI